MHASRNEGSRQRIAQDGSMADARRTCVGAQVEEAGSVGGGEVGAGGLAQARMNWLMWQQGRL